MRKFRISGIKKNMVLPMAILMVLMAALLAGCGFTGGASSSTNTASSASTTPTTSASTVSTAKPGGAAGITMLQGCPNNTVVSNAPKANVTVNLTGNKDQTVSATRGDLIELRFPFGKKWSGPQMATSGPLQLQTPAGYVLQSSKACVWRFNAKGSGSSELHFFARPLCKRGQMCALFIQDVPVTVIVK